MPQKIPCVLMRGGTSKCVTFHAHDLPADPAERDRVLLEVMGSPDPRQIDGLGGSFSTTSKAIIIGPPSVPGADVDYTFAQVSITEALVDYKGNCGNCSGAVGPFAIDEGLVPAVEPITIVRIYNTNTKKIIRAEVPVKNGRFNPDGSVSISGVPKPGSKQILWFDDPGGSVTGKLLPTGNPTDVVDVPGVGTVPISIVDAANPVVFIRGELLGVDGTESPGQLDADLDFCTRVEAVRAMAAEMIGLVPSWREASRSPAVPKVAFVLPPKGYKTVAGGTVAPEEMDLLAKIMSMRTCHRAYALTGAVSTCAAAYIPGTVVYDVVPEAARQRGAMRLGHPSGTIELLAAVAAEPDGVVVHSVSSVRTARRIMDGYVYVSESQLDRRAK